MTLDAAAHEAEPWRNLLLSLIPAWTDSLRRTLARADARDRPAG